MAEQLMTKDEFRQALEDLDMAQREAARFLNVNERTVRAWVSETDTAEPPNTAAMVLLHMLGTKETPNDYADGVHRGLRSIERRRARRSVAA